MEEQFVTKEIAKRLKEKGFDEPCYAYFRKEDDALIMISSGIAGVKYSYITDDPLLAPLWQQVIDWFRVKHNIRIFENTPLCACSSLSFNEDFKFEVVKISGNGGWANSVYGSGGLGSSYRTFPTYKEAREVAIKKALTLIP